MSEGLIYYGHFYFTSCIIGTDSIVWYHDGMTTGSSCENEGYFDQLYFDQFSSRKFLKCKGKKTNLSGVWKSLIRGGKWKWVGGWHYFLFTSKCHSIGMCKFSCVFKVENYIGKLG